MHIYFFDKCSNPTRCQYYYTSSTPTPYCLSICMIFHLLSSAVVPFEFQPRPASNERRICKVGSRCGSVADSISFLPPCFLWGFFCLLLLSSKVVVCFVFTFLSPSFPFTVWDGWCLSVLFVSLFLLVDIVKFWWGWTMNVFFLFISSKCYKQQC